MQSCVSNFKRWKWKFKEVIFPKVIEPGCVKNEETGCFCRNRGGLDGEKFGGSRVSGRSWGGEPRCQECQRGPQLETSALTSARLPVSALRYRVLLSGLLSIISPTETQALFVAVIHHSAPAKSISMQPPEFSMIKPSFYLRVFSSCLAPAGSRPVAQCGVHVVPVPKPSLLLLCP